jgi:hypothetical protein
MLPTFPSGLLCRFLMLTSVLVQNVRPLEPLTAFSTLVWLFSLEKKTNTQEIIHFLFPSQSGELLYCFYFFFTFELKKKECASVCGSECLQIVFPEKN